MSLPGSAAVAGAPFKTVKPFLNEVSKRGWILWDRQFAGTKPVQVRADRLAASRPAPTTRSRRSTCCKRGSEWDTSERAKSARGWG
jgi:hypothetical protein